MLTLKCQINGGILLDRGLEKIRNLINRRGDQNKRGVGVLEKVLNYYTRMEGLQ